MLPTYIHALYSAVSATIATAKPAIAENLLATAAIRGGGGFFPPVRPGRTEAESTIRPPPQTEAARRWSQSIISGRLKSPASEAWPEALAVIETISDRRSIRNRNA